VRTACRLALKTGSYVAAIYVNKGEEYTAEETGWPHLRERLQQELEQRGQDVIRRAAAIGAESGLKIEGFIANGLPAEEIAAYVGAHGIVKLIVIGHSRREREAQGFIGSTTRMILAAVPRTPVLVTSAAREIRSLLVAVDGSEASMQAAAAAGVLARALDADVSVLAVYADSRALHHEYRQIAEVPNLDSYLRSSDVELQSAAAAAAEKALRIVESLAPRASARVVQGYPPEVILRESGAADLTVIGVKHRGTEKKIDRILRTLLDHSRSRSSACNDSLHALICCSVPPQVL
jgi:nucleotide-binding universal stress UspA family protein